MHRYTHAFTKPYLSVSIFLIILGKKYAWFICIWPKCKLQRGIKIWLMYENPLFYLNRKTWSSKGVNFPKLMYKWYVISNKIILGDSLTSKF